MANTYTLISSVTVGSGGAASITFSSISADYTDLLINCSARCDFATEGEVLYISLNTSTSNFSAIYLQGSGSAAASGSLARFGANYPGSTATSNTFGNSQIYIPNYTSANAKSYSTDTVTENNASTAYATLIAGLWNPSSQAAINRIDLTAANGTIVQYSSFYLYGISNA